MAIYSNNNTPKKNYVSEVGVILVLIGIGIIFRKFFPFSDIFPFSAIFHWTTLMIIIGIIRGINKKFMGTDWIIFIFIGVIFALKRLIDIPIFSVSLIFAILLILIGGHLLLTQRRKMRTPNPEELQLDDSPILPFEQTGQENRLGLPNNGEKQATQNPYESTNPYDTQIPFTKSNYDPQDYVSLETFFGSSSKVVISKNLKGGNVSVIFGNSDLILSKADINGIVCLDVFCMFGELKIIVPADFTIINNVTSVLGEFSDKRNFLTETNTSKTLVIRGQVIAGSIKLKNF